MPNILTAQGPDEEAEKTLVSKVIGPEGTDQSCSNCHVLETEAWKQTRHFTTYINRHQSERAMEILANMGTRSMKRSTDCRQCHYTSRLVTDRIRPKWGVSCESCHGAGKDWNNIHNKAGGDPNGKTLKWGEGKTESKNQLEARLAAATAKGMIHSEMIYEIATNCFGCHTVPHEVLVNRGKHKAGSEFDLVQWSQGEVRHNFLSSPGAPQNPTNRPANREEKRQLYVVGAMVDLEISLCNLVHVSEKGGEFHKAMIERVNRARGKVAAILGAAPIPDLTAAVKEVPEQVNETTLIDADLPGRLSKATKRFSRNPPDLSGIDDQIPTEYKGKAFE